MQPSSCGCTPLHARWAGAAYWNRPGSRDSPKLLRCTLRYASSGLERPAELGGRNSPGLV